MPDYLESWSFDYRGLSMRLANEGGDSFRHSDSLTSFDLHGVPCDYEAAVYKFLRVLPSCLGV